MGFVIRGIKNAFRNIIRTFSIVFILAISIGLALIMLLSMKAVQTRIDSVKNNIGNIINVTPAGAQGFEGGGEPLTDSDVSQIKTLPHVTSVNETLNDRLTPGTDTNLTSPITPGTLGNRAGRGFGRAFINGNSGSTNFQVPIRVVGVTDPKTASSFGGGQATIKSGNIFDATKDIAEALVGQNLATKNNLTVGSTFTVYGTTIKVDGIFDSGSQFANDVVVLPIKTLQRLSAQDGQVDSAQVQVDSISNLNSTVNSIKNKLGSKADVVSQQDTSSQALQPLENIKTVSLYSLIGAIVAGAVIIFLTMLMIVRERRREIGVLKAIGAPNSKIMLQFICEAISLTILGGILGAVGGLFFSDPVLRVLVSNATSQTTTNTVQQGMRSFGGGVGNFVARFAPGTGSALQNLHTVLDVNLLLYGIAAILIIAIIGSAVPAFLISRVSPAEVLRGDS